MSNTERVFTTRREILQFIEEKLTLYKKSASDNNAVLFFCTSMQNLKYTAFINSLGCPLTDRYVGGNIKWKNLKIITNNLQTYR